MDIDGYLAHHHDMIVLKSIDDAMKEADRNVQAIQRRYQFPIFNREYFVISIDYSGGPTMNGATFETTILLL